MPANIGFFAFGGVAILLAIQLAFMFGIGGAIVVGAHQQGEDDPPIPPQGDSQEGDEGTEDGTAMNPNGTRYVMAKFEPDFQEHTEQPPSGRHVYYGESDGLCGWWDESNKIFVKPRMNYTNAFAVQEEFEEGVGQVQSEDGRKCLYQFNQAAMQPACGDRWYPQVKYCAMAEFYNNEMPHDHEPKGENKDLMLVMVDGCMVCNEEHSEMEVKVALVNEWPAGSTFTKCAKQQRSPDWYTVDLVEPSSENNATDYANQLVDPLLPESMKATIKQTHAQESHPTSGSFAFPLILHQRRCEGLFGFDPEVNIYTGMKLLIQHECGSEGTKTMEVNLADINPDNFPNKMVELRGMMLLLKENEWLQYRKETFTYWSAEELGVEDDGKPIYENAKGDDDKKKRRKK